MNARKKALSITRDDDVLTRESESNHENKAGQSAAVAASSRRMFLLDSTKMLLVTFTLVQYCNFKLTFIVYFL